MGSALYNIIKHGGGQHSHIILKQSDFGDTGISYIALYFVHYLKYCNHCRVKRLHRHLLYALFLTSLI